MTPMPGTLENEFAQWAKPPGSTEQQRCENAIKAIRKAIRESEKLKNRRLKVFPQGSYRNRVNVRQDSDVDVGVLCDESFFYRYPPGTTREAFGNKPATYRYSQFKDALEEALVGYFGREAVRRGNKAFDIGENSYRVEADVAPFFEYRHYRESGTYCAGVALRSDHGEVVHNYPERLLDDWSNTPLHYEHGVSKNDATARAFKGSVRILKKLRNRLADEGIPAASSIPGFLIECLAWNAPNQCYEHATWEGRIDQVLRSLASGIRSSGDCREWTEVNGLKFLFHATQPWTKDQAADFIKVTRTLLGK